MPSTCQNEDAVGKKGQNKDALIGVRKTEDASTMQEIKIWRNIDAPNQTYVKIEMWQRIGASNQRHCKQTAQSQYKRSHEPNNAITLSLNITTKQSHPYHQRVHIPNRTITLARNIPIKELHRNISTHPDQPQPSQHSSSLNHQMRSRPLNHAIALKQVCQGAAPRRQWSSKSSSFSGISDCQSSKKCLFAWQPSQ